MVDLEYQKCSNLNKIGNTLCLESLKPNLNLDFQNKKWRIQHGGPGISKMFESE